MQDATCTTPATLLLEDLFSIDALASEFRNILSVPTLRWQLRFREKNGLAPCCVRVGKKLLISKSRYECWLASQAGRVE
jgi:hypothetical protein